MKIANTQRRIHYVNTVAIIVLLLTGTLHTLPDLRSSLTGGYDQLVADIHVWTGAIFISFPFLLMTRTQGSLLGLLRLRIFKDPVWHWRRVHLMLTVFVCLIQAIAGLLIWVDIRLPLPITLVDTLFLVHRSGAWYLGLTLPLHMWMARKKIVKTTRRLIGPKPSPT